MPAAMPAWMVASVSIRAATAASTVASVLTSGALSPHATSAAAMSAPTPTMTRTMNLHPPLVNYALHSTMLAASIGAAPNPPSIDPGATSPACARIHIVERRCLMLIQLRRKHRQSSLEARAAGLLE